MNPPETILPRIAQRDPAAVPLCLERYGGLVWSIARRMSPARADAEDAVQEIFADLWKSAGRFDPDRSSEAGFVSMIARRRMIDRLRAAKRDVQRSVDEVEVGDVAASPRAGETFIEAVRAREVLEALPTERRRVLTLCLMEGMTHQQVAAELDLPLGTVKSHVRRGLATIRGAIRGEPTPERQVAP